MPGREVDLAPIGNASAPGWCSSLRAPRDEAATVLARERLQVPDGDVVTEADGVDGDALA